MNIIALAYIRSQLGALPAWQEFEQRRRAKTVNALSAMAFDACERDLNVEEAAKHHLDAILEAAFPLEDLAELLGTDGLAAIAKALGKKGA